MHNNITETKLDNDNDQDTSDNVVNDGKSSDNVETGTIKWFDRKRGFGFIIPDEGDEDILVHSSVIETIGRRDLPEGCNAHFISAQGAKGRHVIEIIEIDIGDAYTEEWNNVDNENLLPPFAADEDFIIAEIKWFSRVKGYGFLVSESCDADIFIHMETMREAGINVTQDNHILQVQFEDQGRGPLATAVRLVADDIH